MPSILLSEGSSLSAREAVTALGLAGFRVELVSSDPLCLARFSRFVRRVHPAPPSGSDPDGYLKTVLDVIERRSIDVLMPVHEQAYLFAAARHRLPMGLGIALADFTAFEQVQSKPALAALLTRIDVPQPATEIIHSTRDFAKERPFPYFVKAPFGTASAGVWRIDKSTQRDALSGELKHRGPSAQPEGAEGVVTRLGLMGLMHAANRRGRRSDVLGELILLTRSAGHYRGSIEELLPLATDPLCIVPLGVLLGALLISPSSASQLSHHTIETYSLTQGAIDRLREWN